MPAPRITQPNQVLYDESDWPILRVTMPSAHLSAAEFLEHIDRVSSFYGRQEPFGLLIDALNAPMLSAMERQLIADRMRFDARRNPGVMSGLAVVLGNAAARGAFTAINWLARPPYPTAAFDGVAAASVWLRRQLLTPTSAHTRTKTG